jgi:holo-[acyl-carrier protein] synthase
LLIVGSGIDLVAISKVKRLLADPGKHFLRNFTENEIEDAGQSIHKEERLAGRFAAKEAVLKAMGVGWGNGVSWLDIEIGTSETGMPHVRLSGYALEISQEQGITSWLISTSHDGDYAIASALALG